ncbi:hypothetical protein FLBR109950_00210 [Flavobacterium branchiophilum]|uniref:Uncharacterized protein n=1 Tax=Flavobacterium branchiophilum (strain FL-15) TaxID=1034807 RepID=G2Z5K6_FLABF|nr:hypothetical protein [Flavobacterium branchiophilum]CCB70804.1 Hypothetical protein FBFL15_2823 [Flavobacterium branchiophilum FL-15]
MSKESYIGGDYIEWTGGKNEEYAKVIRISSNEKNNFTAVKEQTYGESKDPSEEDDKLCTCKVSKKATNFKTLIELVKQAEEMLIQNEYSDMGDRISIIRGVYYGTEWSLDYSTEKSSIRNKFFNIYTGSSVKADARKVLKCSENCKAKLFESLFATPEVFENSYKAVDFGHLIIGLDSRRSSVAKNITQPGQGGTGLELNTWIGDLGGGTANLSRQRIKNSTIRAKTIFPVGGHSYGAMVNLEGDVAAYVVGMNDNKPNDIVDATDNFKTIHEALKDYFDKKWNKRTFYFLAMLGAKVSGNNIIYTKSELESECAEKFEDFAEPYITLRNPTDLIEASNYFKPVSEEVAAIFIDALLHVVSKPEDMIAARIDPNPKPKVETLRYKAAKKAKELYENVKKIDVNPFD